MTIASKDKQKLLDRLTKARIRGVNIPVLRAIFGYINPDLGVAWAGYHHYAAKSGRSERTVQRTIQVARDYLILSLAHREGPPAIWCPELMDMKPEEAVRRADAAAGDFRRGNTAKSATPTSLVSPPPPLVNHPAPSVATTTEPAPAATTAVPAHRFSAPKLAPDLAPDLAPKLAPDLSPPKPQEENSKQKKCGKPASSTPPPTGGGGDGAWRTRTKLPRASSAAHDLVVKIGKRCGLGTSTFEWPEHWRCNAPGIVQSWLTDQGWEERLIWCVVNDAMKKKTDGPPASIRYFEKPIGRLYAELQRLHAELAEFQARQGRQ